jgi:predicted secreted protein
MSWSLALAIYFICWWVVLFTILPLRIGAQPDESTSDPFADAAGAPRAPNIALKFLVTTIVSALIFGAIYAMFAFQLVRLDDLPFLKV